MALRLDQSLNLPLMCAPMSFASSVDLAVACCKAGVIGGWQGGTYTPLDEFERYLAALSEVANGAPPPLVLSSIGDPALVVERVHGWGGKVIHDVTTMRHAEKALAAGADGLMLTCAGAGGHTGFLTPFAFVPAIRKIFDGPLIVAGGIADGNGIAAALALGADIACMGTRFIATPESGVVPGHRQMIPQTGLDEIVISAAMNGVPANWMKPSIEAVGLDYSSLPQRRTKMPEGVVPWRDIWSAGQSVGLIETVEPVADLVKRLASEFEFAAGASDWRKRVARIN